MTPGQRDPKVVVLGGGSWGTTVASICARRGPTLQWVRSEETAKDINENHRNSRYLGDEVELSPTLKATTDFSEAANAADVVVMGVPSHGFRGVLTDLAKELRPWVPVVSLVKGLEQGTNMRMSQIVDEVLPGHPAGILAGPNIAREVAEGYAAAAVLAMPDQQLAAYLARAVPHQAVSHLHHRRRRRRRDGRCAEERLRDRRRHGLFAGHRGEHPRHGDRPRGARDVQTRRGRSAGTATPSPGWPAWAISSSPAPASAAATATSANNSARAKPIDEIIASMNQVAEGVKASSVIMEFADKYGRQMPIAREVDGVINHGSTVEDAYRGPSGRKARPRGTRLGLLGL